MTKNLAAIAREVAVLAKSTGETKDLGCFYDDDWNLTDAEWMQVVDEALALIPRVAIDPAIRRNWVQAGIDMRAAERSERIAFTCDGYHTA